MREAKKVNQAELEYMMHTSNRSLRTVLLGVPLFGVAGLAAFAPVVRDTLVEDRPSVSVNRTTTGDSWRIRATGARIVGGYGDNFAYDGENVRPLEGSAVMTVDAAGGTAELSIEIETTPASGPIRFGKTDAWSGKIKIVQVIDASEMDMARIAEEIDLHGDTGNEAPVMPNIFSYFATWGPAKIWVNGEEVVSMIGSHTMFSEAARRSDGEIVDRSGAVYSPMSQNKSGFTDPEETEFHFVAHTTQPDGDNFPPHSAWIHLNFTDITIEQHPDYVEIPYAQH